MKLITLNIWGGHVRDPLLKFIESHNHIDVFCFQEVYHQAEGKISDDDRFVSLNIFSELDEILSDFQGYFRPVVNNNYGICTFIKKTYEVVSEGEVIIHDNPIYPGFGPTHSRNMQWVEFSKGNQKYSVINVHGLWNGKGKNDSPERLVQSHKIKDFVATLQSPKILCGDFNLRPDTRSMQIIESDLKLNNLIQEYNVNSTRTSLYPKKEKFADYVLTSPEIGVNHFEVMQHEVSDHSPLLLDFD